MQEIPDPASSDPAAPPSRARLAAVLARTGRTMGKASAMLNHACAETLGLHATEWECVTLLADAMDQPLTAGGIAEETGLTTGAVTGVLDRLEDKGWVRRERDPSDRRRVLVHLVPEQLRRADAVLAAMQRDMVQLQQSYTEDQLAAAASLFSRAAQVLRNHALALRTGKPAPDPPDSDPAPDP